MFMIKVLMLSADNSYGFTSQSGNSFHGFMLQELNSDLTKYYHLPTHEAL